MKRNMQIILSAVLHKDNLPLISILLWLYFHLGFTKLAHPELLATIGHLGTATKPKRAQHTQVPGTVVSSSYRGLGSDI